MVTSYFPKVSVLIVYFSRHHNSTWDEMVFKLLKEHPVNCTEEVIISESSTCESIKTLQKDILIHDVTENKPILHTDANDIGGMYTD